MSVSVFMLVFAASVSALCAAVSVSEWGLTISADANDADAALVSGLGVMDCFANAGAGAGDGDGDGGCLWC